ncbi:MULTISPECIES: hypothetical protein [Streptomyces]|uniref:Sulfatase n=1 Tax=Streptomyces avermitilis TaxID=33903 RepID=A0A4D4LLL4_STRAX|nr:MULTISPECIES: hypothetical protein [Streptomyces]GDY61895.1 hypothetical protein SAV14893_012880 [Streptomyces avermitilis]GDY77995.1 hypothetical protein SAV31267_074800 [Streptomyces avermitilis]GDY86869.1 hypothetical protein SAVCW2_60680 [Streptomyces avermitilis]
MSHTSSRQLPDKDDTPTAEDPTPTVLPEQQPAEDGHRDDAHRDDEEAAPADTEPDAGEATAAQDTAPGASAAQDTAPGASAAQDTTKPGDASATDGTPKPGDASTTDGTPKPGDASTADGTPEPGDASATDGTPKSADASATDGTPKADDAPETAPGPEAAAEAEAGAGAEAGSEAAPDTSAVPESDPDPAVPDPSTPDAAVPDPDTPDAAVPDPDTPDAAVPDPDTPDSAPARPGWRGKHPDAARVLAWTATGIAVALVLFALLVPNDLARFTPSRFVRIPAEGILGAALLLVLPPKPRRILAVVGGVGLGLLTILKFLDMGFYWSLERPFDLVLDWVLLDDAESFLKDSIGGGGALAVMIGAIALAVAVIALMTWSVVRLTRLMASRRHFAGRTLLVLGTAWMTCSVLTLEVAGVPVASRSAATLLENRAHAVRAGIKDGQAFARQASVDAFADTPSDQLLTGLRGKDVIFAFIESYGRSAIDDPAMTEPINETLTAKTKELSDAGYSSQSGWLRSPVAGAGSWLAHSTFLSGLWIKNQQRYRNLTSGNRMTLTEAFRRTDAWRTVGIMPGVTRAWPEGKFFGLDHIYDSRELGYQGPKFSWSPVPDQYSLAAFERLEHGKKHSKPLMSEIILTSSHNPWAPIPKTIPEDQVGDGSVYDAIHDAGKDPKEVWKDPAKVRDEYRKAIQYSVTSLVDYVAKHGNKNTVLVFLGDHQPNRTVTGDKAGRDVPIAIVAHDQGVLDRISDWGWTDGLKPASDAPEWRMDTFRDRFLTAYGPEPTS